MTPSDPCCAHLRVSYQTETLPNFGTHGWWACDACDKRFALISNTLSDGETVRPIEGAGVDQLADLRVQFIHGYKYAYVPWVQDPERYGFDARPEVEMPREELNVRYPDTRTYQERFPELFPQQPEEIAPASWWARVWRWLR